MEDSSYFPIRINSIHPQDPITFDLFIKINTRYVHYLHAGEKLTRDKIAKLERHGSFFFVPETARQDFKDYIFAQLNNAHLQPVEKAEILRESSYTLVSELFESPDVHEALEEAKEVVYNFTEFMEAVPEGMGHLLSLSSHDFYTYNHSLDVGIYSLGLGQAAGFSSEEILELGQGSLFHDIGKRNVSVEIICKDGPLDEVEWAQMQKHPLFGLKILDQHEDLSEAVKACCFEHHENFLGTGYPQGLEADEIHPFARIVALTDTYDALTTQRSYNEPMRPKEAIAFMNEKLAGRYDPDFLKIFSQVLFKLD